MLKRHFKTCISCDCPLDYELCLGLHMCDACKVDLEDGSGAGDGFEASFEQAAAAASAEAGAGIEPGIGHAA